MKTEYSRAQTKMNILHTMLLGEKLSDTFKPQSQGKIQPKTLICCSFVKVLESSQKEETENPGKPRISVPELRTKCATRKTMYLVCYSCERSVGSFSWNWSESLTRRRSADTLLKPGVISASTYVLPHSLVIRVLSCGMDYPTLCPGQLHQNYQLSQYPSYALFTRQKQKFVCWTQVFISFIKA